MFDLNELPENEGGFFPAPKAECDAAPAGEGFFNSGNSAKIICRLLRDEEVETKEGSAHSFLHLDSSGMCYPEEDWEALELARYDARGDGIANLVASVPLACVAPDVQRGGLDSIISERQEMAPEVSTGFGISPRPEQLGQKNGASEKRSDYVTDFFHHTAETPAGTQMEKGLGDRAEDGYNLDSPSSSQYPGTGSARKGKRAREDAHGEHVTIDQSVHRLKRQARFTQNGASIEAYGGAGPSLSMTLDQDSLERIAPSTPLYKVSSEAELTAEEAATSLSLGETSLVGLKSAVDQSLDGHGLPKVKAVWGLSILPTRAGIAPIRKGDNNGCRTDSVVGLSGDDMGGVEMGINRIGSGVAASIQSLDDVRKEQPFWEGQLCAEGFSATDVTAYCSEDIQSASKLWNLPKVMRVENIVKLEEFFGVVTESIVDDPIIRLTISPGSAQPRGDSFGSMLESLKSKNQGTLNPTRNELELHLGWKDGSVDGRNGPSASAGGDVAVVKLWERRAGGRLIAEKLYLMHSSSVEAASGADIDFRQRFLQEMNVAGNPEQNILYGILCPAYEKVQPIESSRADEVAFGASDATDVLRRKSGSPMLIPEEETTKVQIVSESASLSEKLDVELSEIERENQAGLQRADFPESTPKDTAVVAVKARDDKDYATENTHEARRSEKSRARKDEVHKDRSRDRDRDGRGRERERDGRSGNKDVHRYIHRSTERGKDLDQFKRGRSKEKDVDRFRERDRHRDSHREALEKSKSGRERTKEIDREKQRDKERQRDREKEKDRERSGRKRDRLNESEKGKLDDKKVSLDSEKTLGSSKEESYSQGASQLGKDIRRRGKIVEKDVAFDEKLGCDLKADGVDGEASVSKKELTEWKADPSCDCGTQDSKEVGVAAYAGESVPDVEMVSAESTRDAEVDAPDHKNGNVLVRKVVEDPAPDDGKDRIVTSSGIPSLIQLSEDGTGSHPFTTDLPLGNIGRNSVPNLCDPSSLSDVTITSCKEAEEVVEHDGTQKSEDVLGSQKLDGQGVHSQEVLNEVVKLENQTEVNLTRQNKSLLSGLASRVEGVSTVDHKVVSGLHVHDTQEKTLGNGKDDAHKQKSRVSLSVRVEKGCDAAGMQKFNDGELETSPRRCEQTIHCGAEDAQALQTGTISLQGTMENGLGPPSLSSSDKDVCCEILLEGCDKETRVWLVSKPNASYLAEEFGVRIVRLEEIPNTKTDPRSKNQQGPLSVRVSLATDKSTDANEAKWFINQAADMLRAVASRGVFAKCLWYQGPVQRSNGDKAPTIQGVVKRIKGEDGKNLERIQEDTGVMIGIVLDANNKKGIVNTSRVIGLRLKCVRKKGFLEATKQVEELLAQVAERFSKDIGASGSQDAAVMKLKLDCLNNTSPSSGILTPMQKDVFAAYSPVSPVATSSPLASFKPKLDEHPSEAKPFPTAPPFSVAHPDSLALLSANPPATYEELATQSQQTISEDEEPDLRLPDIKSGCTRPLYVSSLPGGTTAAVLKTLFEEALKEKFGLPANFDGLVIDVRLVPEKHCAFVEFASDELLVSTLKLYADDRTAFCGLKLEMGSPGSLKSERQFLASKSEASKKGLEFAGVNLEGPSFGRARRERKGRRNDEHPGRFAGVGVRSSTDSDVEVFTHERRYGSRDAAIRFQRMIEKPKPLFLTELMRNASPRSLHDLFEDIIKKYINPSLGNLKGRQTVLDVRYIPSRGCAFVDLATPELVEFMLDLHSRRPEIFYHMKMEIGRRPVPLGQGEEEPVVKRSSNLRGYTVLDETHTFGSGKKTRRQFASISPPRRNEVTVMDHDFVDDYEEDEDDDRQPTSSRKRRSDPERTVYADRLPENASEGMIRRIFERVLREHMSQEQREVLGEHIITEVRYVPTKFCAFVVFVAEDLTRLVLQLYNQDEDIFENMRLKPHFHSRMEDLYREDLHERDDGVHRVLARDTSVDRRNRRGMEEYNHHSAADVGDLGPRGRVPSAHRAVCATAFKEVDRRRSVYVDRIPERLPEPAMREHFERALRQNRHSGFNTHLVSQVTFFRDKFDPDKLCAFVELENEELVQELLDVYMEDEDAFSGMRVRPAVKFGN